MAYLTRIIRVGRVTFNKADRMAKRLDLNKAKVDRKDRDGHNQPQNDPREVGPRQVHKDQVHKPARRSGKDIIYSLIKRYRLLRGSERRKAQRCCGNAQ